jgi:hypothetical protein
MWMLAVSIASYRAIILDIAFKKIHRSTDGREGTLMMIITQFNAAKNTSLLTILIIAGTSASSLPSLGAVSIGAYAVGNHSSCGASNIPGTIVELDKFFDSKDYPVEFEKNFYWKDAQVKQADWIKNGDFQSSSTTNNGYDGADASLLTYIASHGVTSSGVYKALAGSKNFGGCYIPTTSLELGNNASRYTILSTCQGLKIGSGDYPNSSGENPSRTWKNAAKGLNCIFGYSNNMADDDGYGEYFLANIKDGSNSLSKAFMDASESVYSDNIPAVLCFGADEQDAANYIQNNKIFEADSRSNAASSWVYRMVTPTTSSKQSASEIPALLRLRTKQFNMDKIARLFLGQGVLKKKTNNHRVTLWGSSGRATYDQINGTFVIQNRLIDTVKSEDVPDLTEAEKIARHVLNISGIQKLAGTTVLASTSEEVLGGIKGISRVLARKFTYKQELAGATALSQQGSVDITVGPGGIVTEIKSALLEIDPSSKTLQRPTNINAQFDDLELKAIQNVAKRAPGANYRVIKHRIGYDAGNYHQLKSLAPAVIEITVEAGLGEYRRNYIEKINL